MPPTLANGKICHLELPAMEIQRSAEFCAQVFGWNVRKRGDGHTALDDTTGEVSGSWVLGRKPSAEPERLLDSAIRRGNVICLCQDPGR